MHRSDYRGTRPHHVQPVPSMPIHGANGRAHGKPGKRVKQGKATLAEVMQVKSRKKMFAIGLAVLLVIAVIAGLVGTYVYFRTTDSNLDLNPSNAAEALVAASPDDPFYVLCAADLDDPQTKKAETESMGYMLVRVDEPARQMTFITIPSKVRAKMSDGEVHPLTDAVNIGGDAELISALSNLIDVDISHFIYTNWSHLKDMVDVLGGVKLDVTEEVDDPRAGNIVISSGEQVLDGKRALVFLRSTNYADGFAKTAANRVDFTLSLLRSSLESSGLSFASIVGEASKYINTDLTTTDLLSLGEGLRPLDGMIIYECMLPTYESKDGESGGLVCNLYKSQWEALKELVEIGRDPKTLDSSVDSVDPSTVTVEVRNGTQMSGAAAKLGEILTQFGYKVTGVGNTDDGTIYPETLIVYTDPAYEGAAKAIVRDVGSGRIVNGGDFYSSSANVIAIIGADYMPAI